MNGTASINETLQASQSGSLGNKFIIFKLGDEHYGLEILKVKEIISHRNITRLPNLPEYVKGVINLRGSVIPIIDLRLRFGLEEKDFDNFTVIIVAEVHQRTVGLIVDTVTTVDDFAQKEIQQSQDMGGDINVDFIKGLAKKNDQIIILLDVDKALSSKEVMNLQAAVKHKADTDESSE